MRERKVHGLSAAIKLGSKLEIWLSILIWAVSASTRPGLGIIEPCFSELNRPARTIGTPGA